MDSGEIKDLTCYKARKTWSRLDVLPFQLFYLGCLLFAPNYTISIILILVVAFTQVLFFLFGQWFVDFHCFVAAVKVENISDATLVKVNPKLNKGKKELCAIVRSQDASETNFTWQKRKFIYSLEKKQFVKLDFPTRDTFGSYLAATGLGNEENVQKNSGKWGPNKFDIPIPGFMDLYKEQAVAPFFVFQVFCVLLWCLDDYWYYSLFTLALLLLFEATVVQSRLRNLTALRNMGLSPRSIQVFRGKKWQKISTEELLPGDVCSLGKDVDVAAPADLLLLSGTAVINEAILTGESTPQRKESVVHRRSEEGFDIKNDKVHVIFGGSKIIQQTDDNKHPSLTSPDGGALVYVLRTGFHTTQGKLMRVILFSTERVTANTRESLLFIAFLLVFAIAASGYVLKHGLEDENRSRYKLILNCTLIITSVVPPELPMELSLAVNNSLFALHKLGIFCTEPFRIPFAGKINICCFDKTGTLTTDHLILKGIAGINTWDGLMQASEVSAESKFVMAICHSLLCVDKKYVGDPMEAQTLTATGWSLPDGDIAVSPTVGGSKYFLRVIHRYYFSSALKRMSVICALDHESPCGYMIFSKGAPEKMSQFLSSIPVDYERSYKYWTRQGCRVLAMAYKRLKINSLSDLQTMSREEIEKDLIFCGFLVFESPLKPDAKVAMETIRSGGHEVAMITGDNALTACSVAKQLNITTKPTLILDTNNEWVSVDEATTLPVDQMKQLLEEWDFCISGNGLESFLSNRATAPLLSKVKVFARVSPDQKERIVSSLKTTGYFVLMCGDGTNDVGALKQAHVGVAVLNGEPTKKKPTQANAEKLENIDSKERSSDKKASREGAEKRPSKGAEKRTTSKDKKEAQPPAAKRSAPPARPDLKSLMEQLEDGETPLIQLGDASIASPFTSKSSAVLPIVHIIRQGRCTLVTTMQMFKILALNCLISAYSLSVLYLDGVKLGDTQATSAGMLIAMCFLFISRSQPLDKLSKKRPQPNLFTPYMFLTIIGQFAVHLASLIYIVTLAKQLSPQEKADPDKEFAPNLVNSAVFLISCSMQVATFAVNYKGHPFMQSLTENKPLRYALMCAVAGVLYLAAEVDPSFNSSFELVPFPPGFSTTMLSVIGADFVGSWIIEQVFLLLFNTNEIAH